MKKKRTYSTESVEALRIEPLIGSLKGGAIVSVDVAKRKFVAGIADRSGEVVKLFRFEHPKQTPQFLEVVKGLRSAPGGVAVAMEPTGTYGDAIRHQLTRLDIPVWMVAPKKTHDSRALFDDVQSMHDPKSAVHIAKLAAMQLAKPWTAPPAHRLRLRALVELRVHEAELEARCVGRLEALLARHWPELGELLNVQGAKSSLALLCEYPNPARAAAAPEKVAALLRKVSRSHIGADVSREVVTSARNTLGVPMAIEEEQLLATVVRQMSETRSRIEVLERQIKEVGSEDETFVRLASWMGAYSAAVVITLCDPRQYAKARQLEKACGLNLREKSSGEDRRDKVRLRITKRGPALVRKVLYLFALRMIHECPEVRAWYMRRRGYTSDAKQCAVIAVMRKLVRALFHVARGASFAPNALFDVRRLEVPISEPVGATLRRRPPASATLPSVTP